MKKLQYVIFFIILFFFNGCSSSVYISPEQIKTKDGAVRALQNILSKKEPHTQNVQVTTTYISWDVFKINYKLFTQDKKIYYITY